MPCPGADTGWLVDAAVGWFRMCPDIHPQDREETKKQLPVLPSRAGPCSPGCLSASHFHGHVLKGPLQSVGPVPAPAVGPGLSQVV